MKYQKFIFENYTFDEVSGKLSLHYSLDEKLHFAETYKFDFPFANYDKTILDKALQLIFFMAGVSYFKTYLPGEITVKQGQINHKLANFLNKTWQRGLGEFFYVNKLDPNTKISFPINTENAETTTIHDGTGLLVGLGGGKDSLVSVEILRSYNTSITTWSLGHKAQLQPLVNTIGLPHYSVERQWDKQLIELNKTDAYNGHVPISAILACVGTVVAILSGKRDIVVSNEQSANEPTLTYEGVDINHQYSKSQEFEQDFQQILSSMYGDSLRYYSLLRPFSELKIAEIFASIGFDKYKDAFSSCNRAFTADSRHMIWCGQCPKCAFVFMILTPFIDKSSAEVLFHGKNLLTDENMIPMYKQLLGIEGDKPLECVGEIKESRSAMAMCFEIYPELASVYRFELPDDYNYAKFSSHQLPDEISQLILQFSGKL